MWVRGDHEYATRLHLSAIIAHAARLDDADVVVDLSEVTFMDASTINTVVVAHNRLRARSRSLSVRAPSRLARRLLDVCRLAFLIDDDPTRPPVATALDSWVEVPASDRASGPPAQPPVTEQTPARETVRPTTQRLVELAGSVRQPRAPS